MNSNEIGVQERMVNSENSARWLKILFFASIVILMASIVVLCSVPPISKDALTHHLALPKLYLRHGGIYEIPFMPYSYFPMNLQLIYLIPLYFGNDIAPKFIHFSFAILTALLIYNYLNKRLGKVYGSFGALFFLSLPIIVKLSITVYVDLGLIFFSTGSLLFLLKWPESGFRLKYLLYSALFCGLALGTKYNGLITFFLLTLFVPVVYFRTKERGEIERLRPLGYALFFFLVALALFSPWAIKNLLWTGNPIYPLYDRWFNPANHPEKGSIGVFAYRALVYDEEWWEILLLPLRIFFQGQDGNPRFFDGKLNPFLLLFPILAFVGPKADETRLKLEKKIFLAFAVLYFAFAFFSSSLRIRYISPIIPPLVILSIFGIHRVFNLVRKSPSGFQKYLVSSMLFISILGAVVWNVSYVVEQFRYVKPLSYLAGRMSRHEYITKFRPEYPVIQYVNEKLPIASKILFVFIGNRGYYCDRCYIFDMVHNKSMLAETLRKEETPSMVLERLRKKGITHILMNARIFTRWARATFNPQERERLDIFVRRHTKMVYSQNGYILLQVGNYSSKYTAARIVNQ